MGSFGFSQIFSQVPPPHPTSSPSGTDGDQNFESPPSKFREKPWPNYEKILLIYKSNECTVYCIAFCWRNHCYQCGDIWFLRSFCELDFKEHMWCDIFYQSSKWMDVNPQSWDTTVLLRGHHSNDMVGFVYIKRITCTPLCTQSSFRIHHALC